ncbi:unnamed protein product [Vitrella brassicaformis CCMP3155]|uniref:N-acetyl-gamma-glutamyl-phosphate reductase n=1 Tax=Vitrella brassicaformis (strain CCMP3155) TaxID=1169540 RepID=A0A0G4GXC9_VITBC|nr:unnamed protein product [Vitrella brassicaformis CCMP3155]|eukprot:CEM35718.1 unnamed protein product [Vitrella brassicaformis CCMP3155]
MSPATLPRAVDGGAADVDVSDISRSRVSRGTLQEIGSLIKSFGRVGALDRCWQYWNELRQTGTPPPAHILTIMVSALANNGQVGAAMDLLRSLEGDANPAVRASVNEVHYSRLLTALIRGDRFDEALALLSEWRQRQTGHGEGPQQGATRVLFHTILDALARMESYEQAEWVVGHMGREGVPPSHLSYTILLRACEGRGDGGKALRLLQDMYDRHIDPDSEVYEAVVSALAGSPVDLTQDLTETAMGIVADMEERHVPVTAAILIPLLKVFARCRKLLRGVEVCEDLADAYGMAPSTTLYQHAIRAAFDQGSTDTPDLLLKRMHARGVLLSQAVYDTLVDGYARNKRFEEGISTIREAFGLPQGGTGSAALGGHEGVSDKSLLQFIAQMIVERGDGAVDGLLHELRHYAGVVVDGGALDRCVQRAREAATAKAAEDELTPLSTLVSANGHGGQTAAGGSGRGPFSRSLGADAASRARQLVTALRSEPSVQGAGGAQKIRVGVLGASGYTGAELVRLLLNHPIVDIQLLTASQRSAGQTLGAVYPQFDYVSQAADLPRLMALEEASELGEGGVDVSSLDAVFCALPHAKTQEFVKVLPASVKVIDLSADFRLMDTDTYEQWYGKPHAAPDLQATAVYGLPELHRTKVEGARICANPGCYPTPAQLALCPLLSHESGPLIDADSIIIDAKSGVTGAGRAPKQNTLFCEVADGMHAYGVAAHRHAPEIEQGLSEAAGRPVVVNFTPHLVPLSRGIFETMYVKMRDGVTAETLKQTLADKYAPEPFVHVLEGAKSVPETRHVRGSNVVAMNVFADRISGRAIITAVMDNLCKGASGQAVQNFNIMFGLPETTALSGQLPLFP